MNDRQSKSVDYFTTYKNTDAKELWQQLGAAIPVGDTDKPGVGQFGTWMTTKVREPIQDYMDHLEEMLSGLMETWTGDGATEFEKRVKATVRFADMIQQDVDDVKTNLDEASSYIKDTQDAASDPDNIPDGWDFAKAGFLYSGFNPTVGVVSGIYGWATGDDREKEAHEKLAKSMSDLSDQYDVCGAAQKPTATPPDDVPTGTKDSSQGPTGSSSSAAPSSAGTTSTMDKPANQDVPGGKTNQTAPTTGTDATPPSGSDGLQSGGSLGSAGGLGSGGAGTLSSVAPGGAAGAGPAPGGAAMAPGANPTGGAAKPPTPTTGSGRGGMMGSGRGAADQEEETDERDTWLLEDEMVWDDGDFRPPPVLK